jgi:hypothetical protein
MSVILGGNCIDWPTTPGQWQIRVMGHGPHLLYGCPNGRGSCGVPIQPSPPNQAGCSWNWDGNTDAPTLTPSINCIAGCGWHGFMTKGELK